MAVKRCKAAFAVFVNGSPRMLNPGVLVDESDPIVKSHPHFFEDVETYVSDRAGERVEQATAEPGEKRTVTPTARRSSRTKSKGESQ